MTIGDYQSILKRIQADGWYQQNLDQGKPRRGHPEGTIRAHIAQLETNLESLRSRVSEADYWKLKILIHVHDTFKPETVEGVRITDPRSHASLARDFLAAFVDDSDLLNMVQFHDEPYALFQQQQAKGHHNSKRLEQLVATIKDWNLFLTFLLIDGSTPGKSPQPLQWFFILMTPRVRTDYTAADANLLF